MNWIATLTRSEIDALAAELAKLLNGDAKLRRRAGGAHFWVEFGQRAFFKPIKKPNEYQIVDQRGRLRTLAELSPAAVRAIMSMWYEHIHLRMFVIADREFAQAATEHIRRRASELLPIAVGNWYRDVNVHLGLADTSATPAP